MGAFKLRPTNRQMGFVGETESLWPSDTSLPPDKPNMGMAEGYEPHPVELLMARMDRLENTMSKKMDEMKTELGRGSSTDKLTEKVEDLVGEALYVAMNPPSTWKQHLSKGDAVGLVDKEYKELQKALKEKPKEARKEAVHTMAALMRACL